MTIFVGGSVVCVFFFPFSCRLLPVLREMRKTDLLRAVLRIVE